MSFELHLSEVTIQKKLQIAMWASAALCTVWGIGVVLAISSARGDLSSAQAALQSKRTALSNSEITLRAVGREVDGMPAKDQAAVFPGTAVYAERISSLAGEAGAQMSSIEFGADSSSQTPSSGAPPPAGKSVQFAVTGSFVSDLRALNNISYSNLDLQVTQIQIEREQIDAQTGMAPVEMRVTGEVMS